MSKKTIKCQVCGKHFKSITPTHLFVKHEMTMRQYKKLYPDAKTVSSGSLQLMSKSAMFRHKVSPMKKETKKKISKSQKQNWKDFKESLK